MSRLTALGMPGQIGRQAAPARRAAVGPSRMNRRVRRFRVSFFRRVATAPNPGYKKRERICGIIAAGGGGAQTGEPSAHPDGGRPSQKRWPSAVWVEWRTPKNAPLPHPPAFRNPESRSRQTCGPVNGSSFLPTIVARHALEDVARVVHCIDQAASAGPSPSPTMGRKKRRRPIPSRIARSESTFRSMVIPQKPCLRPVDEKTACR